MPKSERHAAAEQLRETFAQRNQGLPRHKRYPTNIKKLRREVRLANMTPARHANATSRIRARMVRKLAAKQAGK